MTFEQMGFTNEKAFVAAQTSLALCELYRAVAVDLIQSAMYGQVAAEEVASDPLTTEEQIALAKQASGFFEGRITLLDERRRFWERRITILRDATKPNP